MCTAYIQVTDYSQVFWEFKNRCTDKIEATLHNQVVGQFRDISTAQIQPAFYPLRVK